MVLVTLLLVLVAGCLAGPAAAGPTLLTLTAPAAFSPNDDGVKDGLVATVTLASPATVTLTVRGAGGELIVTLLEAAPLPLGATPIRWDGRAGAARLADGSYRIAVVATLASGAVAEAGTTVRIDTEPPRLAWVDVPSSIGSSVLHARFRVTDAAPATGVSLRARDRQGRAFAGGQHEVPVGLETMGWTFQGAGGGRLPPGAFRVWLTAVDDAGNRGTSSPRALLVEYRVAARVVRRVEGAGRRVALTFDDCNDGAAWSRILSVLGAARVKAGFFCLGSQIARHAAEARRTLRDGHSIGNHSWNHVYLPELAPAGVAADVRRATLAWWRLARQAPMPFYRPPYGALDADAARGIGAAGYGRIVLWDVDPQDWRRPGAAAIAARAVGPARAGSIILLHALPQTAAALPEILAGLRAKGLRPVGLDELFAAAGR
ncbi:MAG: polysaccharide deacetylase family protein [Gaiellales bacterium]